MQARKRLIVVGNGMVGYKFCEKMVEKGGNESYELMVFGEEPRPAYDRVHLSEYFSGKTAEDLTMAPASWYAENGVILQLCKRIVAIDRMSQTIQCDTEEVFSYDRLVLATGSSPFVPPLSGIDQEGVFVYRTIEDLEAILEYGLKSSSAAVIGGGLLGLEAAKALLDMGLETHVVEMAPFLMCRQLDAAGAALLQAQIETLGIQVWLSQITKKLLGEGQFQGLEFETVSLPLDMVVVSAGIRPRDELAKKAELTVGNRGGIVVNDYLETSDSHIYAIGECALHQGKIYGLVGPGYQMAEVLSTNLTGGLETFTEADMSTQLKLLGVDVASFGESTSTDQTRTVVLENQASGIYKKLNLSKDGQTLLGGLLVGDASEYRQLHQMMQNELPVPEMAETLLVKANGDASGPDLSVNSLPDSAKICTCESVSKGTMVQAIHEQGGCSLDQLKACTKGGTGCGGCMPLMTELLQAEMKKLGATVQDHLCEHFPFSREALRKHVKEYGLRSFSAVLEKFGMGKGCEKCKPVVASILSGCWGEQPIRHQTIQDTNDFFLANIQKNGSYSVVPRVPGGEITPEQLIAIGQVAQEFNLYTKITGGQRIDLFGARQEDLPHIWQRLIDVGMESGQAYGKALRTVKSCVGWTWCRFGVQDSTGLAIKIENRYRGLRAPHKLKGGVSGCLRECAEARGKDFGVIATERGWNLYVCGNGGTKPQHAVLLAGDISESQVIRYLDRFLMYYIRTAKHLQRTAPWLNEMEGGIERLYEIIVDDCLGLGQELEAEMQSLVDHYQCEWKAVLDNPEKLQRFQPFLNTQERDPAVQFVPERGQIRPKLVDNSRLVNV